jgi:Alpha/beta hydrolase
VTYDRPLNDAERRLALDPWENPAILDGVTTPQTDPVDPHTLITLPRPQDQVGALVAASSSLNQYTLAVAAAFDNADSGMLALLAQDPAALQNRLNWLRADPRRWNQLSPAEQEILIEAMPAVIGAMNGLPAVARDQANRIVLQRTKEALEARLRELEALAGQPPSMYPEYVDPNAGEIDQIRDKLRGIELLEQRLADQPGRQPAFLLGFSGEGNGRVIVALGNPDLSDNVVTYVPGTGARLGAVRSELPRADAMAYDANHQYPDESTSVILWMDYDAPQDISSAAFDGYAEDGAPALRGFQEGLDVAHTRGGAYNTVVGHSYGTVLVGEAVRGGQLDAENYVLMASPGVNANHVSDLGVPPDRVYASTAPGDPIRHTPGFVHGTQPVDPDFGARTFESSNGGEGSPHSNYWDTGNPARGNLAAIVTGNGDRVAPPLPPPPVPTGPTPAPSPGPAPTPPR